MVPNNIAVMLAIIADLKRRDFICIKNKLNVNYLYDRNHLPYEMSNNYELKETLQRN